MRYRNPGVRHFVSCTLSCTNPLVWIRVERIIYAVVILGGEDNGCICRNQRLITILIGVAVVPASIPVGRLTQHFTAANVWIIDFHAHGYTTQVQVWLPAINANRVINWRFIEKMKVDSLETSE